MNKLIIALGLMAVAGLAQAADFSGVYTCKGQDAHEGAYTAKATLKRVPAHSAGAHVAYDFRLDVDGFGSYPGHAVAKGLNAAIYFANTDPATQDFGTGLAQFKKNRKGQWTFTKFYYEPAYKGGSHGTEVCVKQ